MSDSESSRIYLISGVEFQVVKPGAGREKPGAEDVVQLVYTATSAEGRPYDSSGVGPRTMPIDEEGPGVAEALQMMSVGERARVRVPAALTSDEARRAGVGPLEYDLHLVGFTRTREYPEVPIELRSPSLDD
jgi:FKBP-type peptidyl-prolyl cis-trans isomerase